MEGSGGYDVAWGWLIASLLLALLALGFVVGAQRFHDKRVGWLLSASVAAGLAMAYLYNFIHATVTSAIPAAGFVVFIAILMCVVRGITQHGRPGRE